MATSKLPLKLQNVSKVYKGGKGIHDISFEVEAGEVFGFLGPNGAGKSTTIKTILNFINPTSGQATVYGLDSKQDSVKVKTKVGYLAGDIALYENMTGKALIDHMLFVSGQPYTKYIDELIDKLQAQLDRPIETLSKGNKQKIGLILAFMHKPDLIILDEPTSGLDPLMKQVFYDMVLEARNEGKTIFVSSHDLTEVRKICGRAAFIREGKLIKIEEIEGNTNLQIKRIRLTFDSGVPEEINLESVSGVEESKIEDKSLVVTIRGSVADFLEYIAKFRPNSIETLETTLEELFIDYYK
jgi:ABC-2 type transport system ATP-binding protein